MDLDALEALLQCRLCRLISLRLGVTSDVNHGFSSSVTLLQLVKGLKNLLEAERLLHHGPNLHRTNTQQHLSVGGGDEHKLSTQSKQAKVMFRFTKPPCHPAGFQASVPYFGRLFMKTMTKK